MSTEIATILGKTALSFGLYEEACLVEFGMFDYYHI